MRCCGTRRRLGPLWTAADRGREAWRRTRPSFVRRNARSGGRVGATACTSVLAAATDSDFPRFPRTGVALFQPELLRSFLGRPSPRRRSFALYWVLAQQPSAGPSDSNKKIPENWDPGRAATHAQAKATCLRRRLPTRYLHQHDAINRFHAYSWSEISLDRAKLDHFWPTFAKF